jgi:hypothetical protein
MSIYREKPLDRAGLKTIPLKERPAKVPERGVCGSAAGSVLKAVTAALVERITQET